jgi:hypothetical protein
MLLAVITLALIAVALGFFVYGAWGLSKYAFRLGTGPGLLCLLFPPYTFYFAFFKLEEEGKDFPTAAWLFGILTTALLVGVFWSPLSKVATGDFESLEAGGAGSAVKEYQSESSEADESATDEAADEEEAASDDDEEEKSAEAEGEGNEAADSDSEEAAAEGDDAEKGAEGAEKAAAEDKGS